MTKEEKQLLLKDLCARLPYGVICTDNRHGDSRVFYIDVEDEKVYYTDFDEYGLIEYCMPYLRPMSSMTDEEAEEYTKTFDITNPDVDDYDVFQVRMVDWLLEHHFDVRGLIDKGLALEASEGMYK